MISILYPWSSPQRIYILSSICASFRIHWPHHNLGTRLYFWDISPDVFNKRNLQKWLDEPFLLEPLHRIHQLLHELIIHELSTIICWGAWHRREDSIYRATWWCTRHNIAKWHHCFAWCYPFYRALCPFRDHATSRFDSFAFFRSSSAIPLGTSL